MIRNLPTLACTAALLAVFASGCDAQEDKPSRPLQSTGPFQSTEMAQFNEPWAMTFLPDGRLLVSEK